jgi:DsbC/DsbD-like thiol-disulfide interchange protein
MIRPNVRVVPIIIKAIFALGVAASSATGAFSASHSPWVEGPSTKARLLAGGKQGDRLLAFIEIALEPGWKTYWRSPGDAGGLPPTFDWSKSGNLSAAEVLYPAPQRFVDKSGTTIGYQDGLVLPVAISPAAAGEPIALVVAVHYGICKDVCIPVEAELALDLEPGGGETVPTEGAEALARVPRAQDALEPEDPALVNADAVLDGTAPRIRISARFPRGEADATAFLEAPDGLFLPVPEVVETGADGVTTFEAPLGTDVDLAALKGKTVTVTLVGAAGASTATFSAN